MASRCFSGPKRAVTTSSDRTQQKKDVTIYKDLRSFAATPKQTTMQGFRIGQCGSNGTVLQSAGSYDLLDSATRGKYYANPQLQGAGPEALDESWGSALLQQKFLTPPVTGLSALPTDCSEEDCAWTGGFPYPEYTIDISEQLVERCIPPPGAKRISPWHENMTVAFSCEPAYWSAVNAQPLQGIRLRAPLHLETQTAKGDWVPASDCKNREATVESQTQFCQGKGAIN